MFVSPNISLFRTLGGPSLAAVIQPLRRFCLWLLVCVLCASGAQSAWAQPTAAPSVNFPVANHNSATLSWSAVSGATIYDIYQSTSAGTTGTLVNNSTTTSKLCTNLTDGTTYYFQVCARNSSGSGPLSTQVNVTPVAPPTMISVLVDNNSVTLNWNAVVTPNLSYYEVLRGVYGSSDPLVLIGTTTDTTYTDTSVTNGTAYAYRIRVANPDPNPNLFLNSILAKPVVTPAIGAVAGNREVTISFAALPEAQQYHLFVSTVAGDVGTYSAASNTPVFNYSGGPMVNGTTYYFTMRPYTGWGTPTYSNQVACTPVAAATLNPAVNGDGSVSLSWNTTSIPNLSYYEVYRALTTDAYGTTPIGTTTGTTYVDTTVVNGTGYKYKVRAANPLPNAYLDSNNVTITPLAPPVVTAVPGVAQVALSWPAVTGAGGYRIYQSTVAGEQGTLVSSPSTNSSTRSGLTNGTTYYYQVMATLGSNVSLASVQVAAKPLALPTAVSPVTLTPGDSQIQLSFPAIANASEYRIYRSTTSNTYDYGTPTLTATGTGTVTATDTGLTNGTTYYYVVRTVNTSGVSASSAEVSTAPVAAPVLDLAVQGDNSIALSWSVTTGASAYEVYRALSSTGFGSTPLATVSAPATTYTDSTAVNGTTYYYKIVAANPISNPSLSSNVISAKPIAAPTLSGVPSPTRLDLSWNAVAGAIDYTLYQSTDSGDLGTALPATTATTSARTGLTNGTTYYFRIRARNSTGNGPLSAQFSLAPVAAPSLAIATVTESSASLSWTFSGSASYYEIYRTTYGTSFGTTPLTTTTTNTYVDNTVVPGGDYSYRVRVANPTPNASLTSNTLRVKPMAPPELSAVPGSGEVTLNWTLVAGGGDQIMYMSTVAGQLGTFVGSLPGQSTNRTGLTNGTTYYFTLRVSNGSSYSYSSQVSCTPIPAATLSLAGFGDNSVSLSWTAVDGVSGTTGGYQIYRALSGENYGTTPLVELGASTLSYTDNTVVNGTTYKYKVRASNPNPNPFLDSNSVAVAPMAQPVVTTVAGHTQATVKWTAAASATIYDIYQSTTPVQPATAVQTAPITSTNISRTGLTNGTTYYFWVRGRSSYGNGPVSAPVTCIPVDRPTLSVTGLANGSVSLGWTAVSGATGDYAIYRTLNGQGFGTTPLATVSSSTLSYTDSTATNNTTYVYKVVASNPDLNTNLSSNTVLAISVATPVVTAVPGVAKVTLSWTAVPGAAAYRAYMSTSAGTQGSEFANTSSLSATCTGLTNGVTYYFRVVPYNSTGVGQASAQVSAVPQPIPAVVSPVTLTPGDSQIGISFPSVTYATEYRIYRATTSNGYNYTTPTLTATGTGTITATDTGLANGTTYYYVVRSANPGGASASSTQVSTTTLAKPVAPTLSATAGNAQVSLSWGAVASATSYTLKRSETAGGPYTTVSSSITGTSYTDTGLTNFTTYYYVLAGNNASGTGTFSNEVEATPRIAPVSAPGNLHLTTDDLSVTLSWDAVATATGYKLVRSTTPGDFTNSEVVTTTATTYTDNDVQHATTYYYQVRATNQAGDGPAASGSITVYARLRFDAQIASSSGTDWVGSGVINATGDNQNIDISPIAGQVATYRIKVTRSGGEGSAKEVRITAPNLSSVVGNGWTVAFYDAISGGNLINTQIASTDGWSVWLNESDVCEFRVEVGTPSTATPGALKALLIRATEYSPTENLSSDTVKASTQARASQQPDISVRSLTSDNNQPWTGEGITSGTPATLTKSVAVGTTQSYEVRVKNVGAAANSFQVKLPATVTGWTESLFDGLTSTTDITSAARSTTGWTTPQIAVGASISLRLEVTGTLVGSNQRTVLLGASSALDADTVNVQQSQIKLTGFLWSRDGITWSDISAAPTIKQYDVLGFRVTTNIAPEGWDDIPDLTPVWDVDGDLYKGKTVWIHFSQEGSTHISAVAGNEATTDVDVQSLIN